MQRELGAEAVILGVDAIGQDSWSDLATDESDLPWLQDVEDVGAWDLWGVTWRDVWVLDAGNHLTGIYNLTEHDLGDPDAYRAMKDMILAAGDRVSAR